MEIASLGSMYLDNVRSLADNTPPVNGPESFAEKLKRASAGQDSDSSLQARYGASPYGETPIDKSDKLYQLCLELETFVIKNLVTSMRSTVQKSGLVDDSFAGKMYEDMLYDEYAKNFTKSANFGLAEQAYRQLMSFQ